MKTQSPNSPRLDISVGPARTILSIAPKRKLANLLFLGYLAIMLGIIWIVPAPDSISHSPNTGVSERPPDARPEGTYSWIHVFLTVFLLLFLPIFTWRAFGIERIELAGTRLTRSLILYIPLRSRHHDLRQTSDATVAPVTRTFFIFYTVMHAVRLGYFVSVIEAGNTIKIGAELEHAEAVAVADAINNHRRQLGH